MNGKASAGTEEALWTRHATDIRHWAITESGNRGCNGPGVGDCMSLERSQGRANCQMVQIVSEVSDAFPTALLSPTLKPNENLSDRVQYKHLTNVRLQFLA